MILDMNQTSFLDGVITFPDWPFVVSFVPPRTGEEFFITGIGGNGPTIIAMGASSSIPGANAGGVPENPPIISEDGSLLIEEDILGRNLLEG